ncbi:hypothetical protein AJ78_01304 [Emergomyces pasteurianus Ep9510]|uniref:Uncharacterized protein n=1 Tax=Emergomyces pasteurianus Ep9510 TaxID=1447872 RepID=A0A1J9PQH5_9EURO|nr:hypothetical protein AJ78_01304 [Emergomyces pasteurianus Ep9510]
MGKIEISWDLDGGQITAEESVSAMVDVIRSKNIQDTGTFCTWENEWLRRLNSSNTRGDLKAQPKRLDVLE